MTVQCVGSSGCNDSTMGATEFEGVNAGNKGTCEGDSGGPRAIDSLGRAMGSVSRGPANACNQSGLRWLWGQAA